MLRPLAFPYADIIQTEESGMVTTLAELLPHAARIHADRMALIVDDRQFSFRELDAMSNRVASAPAAIGVNPGDRVSLFGPNSWEWLVSYCRAQTLWRIVASILRHTQCLAQCSLLRQYPPRRRARSCAGC